MDFNPLHANKPFGHDDQSVNLDMRQRPCIPDMDDAAAHVDLMFVDIPIASIQLLDEPKMDFGVAQGGLVIGVM